MERAFRGNVDYAQLVKIYGSPTEDRNATVPLNVSAVTGTQSPETRTPITLVLAISSANLTMRMGMRRFTRLTNAFSKKIENHAAAVALGYFAYNFIKNHRTLRVIPAMAAGVTDRLWEVSDFIADRS